MIRVATPADAETIARVHVATWRVAYAGLIDNAFLAGLSVPANAVRWAGLLADRERRVWITVDGTGFLAAGAARDDDLPPRTGEVYAAYVLPAAQRQGAGRELITAAEHWFAHDRRPGAALWVLSANVPAQRFYAACGWAPDGTEREMDIGGVLVHETRFRRAIPPLGAT